MIPTLFQHSTFWDISVWRSSPRRTCSSVSPSTCWREARGRPPWRTSTRRWRLSRTAASSSPPAASATSPWSSGRSPMKIYVECCRNSLYLIFQILQSVENYELNYFNLLKRDSIIKSQSFLSRSFFGSCSESFDWCWRDSLRRASQCAGNVLQGGLHVQLVSLWDQLREAVIEVVSENIFYKGTFFL